MKNLLYNRKSKSVSYRYLFWNVSSLHPKLKQLVKSAVMVFVMCLFAISSNAQCNTYPAPGLMNTSLSNNCPNAMADLSGELPINIAPPGATWTWHTGAVATAANEIPLANQSSIATSGTYYIAFHDPSNSCYGPTTPLTVNILNCTPCYYLAAPVLTSSSITNNYPFNSIRPYDIREVNPSNNPFSGPQLTLHTGTPATSANKIQQATTSGTYYTAMFNSAQNCYSGAGSGTTPINITIGNGSIVPPITPTQCSNLTELSPTSPLLSNLISASPVSYACSPSDSGFALAIGSNDSVGEFTANFQNPTGLIQIESNGMNHIINGNQTEEEYIEVWLNGTFIDLSTFPGVSLQQGGCASNTLPFFGDSTSITSAGNLGYPNKAGVLYIPKSGGIGEFTLTIDLESYGLAASQLRVRCVNGNFAATGYTSGIGVRASYCSDPAQYPSRISYPCMTAGVSVPAISASSALVNCISNTADLSSITASNAPPNTILTYHTSLPATSSNQITTSAAPLGGPYHVVFYDTMNTCYGTVDTLVTVNSNCPCTAAGTVAPALSATTASNACPSTTVDLTSITASNLPTNTSLTWHTTTPATNANKITGSSISNSGTYYAAFYDANGNCYSGTNGSATTALSVTINGCGTQCSNASAPLDGNGPLVSNKSNANYSPTFFCGTNTGPSIYVGGTDPFSPPGMGTNGEFTVTFPNPTGLIELDIRSIDGDPGMAAEYVEIWLNDTLIDLSTFPGVSLSYNMPGCTINPNDTAIITTASNMGYANKAGVLIAPAAFQIGNARLIIDLEANGLAASKLRYRNIHTMGDGFGTRVRASWCTDSALYPVRLTYPCTAVGSAAPNLSSTSVAVNCTSSTADISSLTASNAPANTSITYHTALPASSTNQIIAATAGQGSYYAVFYDNINMCYGFASAQISVTSNCPCATAGSNAPTLSSTTATNSCPTNTVDLTTITASNLPASTTLTWHTGTPATNQNKITGTSVSASGTYYGAFYDATNNCYSGIGGSATTAVTVTVANCCIAGSNAPNITNWFYGPNTHGNLCPSTTVDLDLLTANNIPAGAILSWHTATPATLANKVSGTGVTGSPMGIPYYGAVYDSVNGCFSGNGSATTLVTVYQAGCCNAGFSSPLLSSTTSTNVCPATTADLTAITASNLQAGSYISWHTSTPASDTNKVSGTAVMAGTYYAAFHDSINNCYSGFTGDSTTAVTVTISPCAPTCVAGSMAPVLSSTTATNSCPSNSTNLTTITANNMPSGTTLTWHTATPATNTNKVTGTAVSAGTYYAAFYDANFDCYSGTSGSATTAVTVTQTPCCNAGTVAPTVN